MWQDLFLTYECVLLFFFLFPNPMLQADSLALPIALSQGSLHGAKQELMEEGALVL